MSLLYSLPLSPSPTPLPLSHPLIHLTSPFFPSPSLPSLSYLLLVPLQSLIDLSSLVNTAISCSDTSLVADSKEVIDFITGNVLLVSEVSVNDDDGVINDDNDEFILLLFSIMIYYKMYQPERERGERKNE